MKRVEQYVISKAALGLFHGRDCFDAYKDWSRHAELVHDIHLKPGDQIDDSQLHQKVEAIRAREPLKIVYAGRAADMKGALEWVEVLGRAARAGVAFQAAWLGDGPLLGDMRRAIVAHGIEKLVSLPGNVSDRVRVMNEFRAASVFLFCHKTPESPRCLIEALVAGTALVGYDMSYPRDLVGTDYSSLVPLDAVSLAARLVELDRDRETLAAQVVECARLGEAFSDEVVFRHRSELIKRFLPAPASRSRAHVAT